MEPALIVDLLDEVGKVLGDILESFERHRIDCLDLQCFHEALGLGVVVRVPRRPIQPMRPLAASVWR